MKANAIVRVSAGALALVMFVCCASCTTFRSGGVGENAVGANKGGRGVSGSVPVEQGDFILGMGDSVNVKVWRNDELNRAVRVDPSGNVNFPLVGQIHVEGMSLSAFQQLLVARLGEKYLVNPQVDVSIAEVRSRKIYVLGEVENPGALTLEMRVTPWEAVANAGGFTTDANRSRLLLIRHENGVAGADVIDLSGLARGEELRGMLLKDRDILYVLPSRIASVERFMVRLGNMVSPIVGAESALILSREAKDVLSGKRQDGTSVVVPK